MIYNRVGAPEGGRVHYFLLYLNAPTYNVINEYANKSYLLLRYKKRTLLSVITVVRTNPRTYRLTYYNVKTGASLYKSFPTAKRCAAWVNAFAFKEKDDEKRAYANERMCKAFSSKLKMLMRYQCRTQAGLAQDVGISQQTIRAYLNKKYLPTWDVLQKIADVLGVDAVWLTLSEKSEV